MEIRLQSGKYIVAVSGGVDSVTLLSMLSKVTSLELIVAHFDHGIRQDSAQDKKFVSELAKKYNLQFEYAEGNLGSSASESIAREARYKFLCSIRQKHSAIAIVTAHHQDDLLETAIINWLRGTGRRGLSSLSSTGIIKRPLLQWTKTNILDYAHINKLAWREDSTNTDEKHLRNYIRRQIMPLLSAGERTALITIINKATNSNMEVNLTVDQILENRVSKQKLNRQWFINLPHIVAREIMASWLRQGGIELDRRLIERLVVAAKTYPTGKYADANNNYRIKIGPEYLALEHQDR